MGSSLFLATSLGLLFGAFLIFGLIRMILIADCSSSAFRVFPIETKKAEVSILWMLPLFYLSERLLDFREIHPSVAKSIRSAQLNRSPLN